MMDKEAQVVLASQRALSASSLKITDGGKQLKESIEVIFNGIEAFNALAKDEKWLNGNNIHSIKIVKEFQDFIYPNSIMLDVSSSKSQDLLHRSGSSIKFDITKFNDAQMYFMHNFKKYDFDNETISLQDLKKNVNIFDVIDRVYLHNKKGNSIHLEDTGFIPYPINIDVSKFYKAFYLNATDEEAITLFINNMFL